MNIFILNSGRCGSTTFIKACNHISNYSAGHETRINLTGEQRLAYPHNHIEADNRLSWLLGRLDKEYGDNAFYVHLKRNPQATVASFMKRSGFGIMKAYREGILLDRKQKNSDEAIAHDYLQTVTENIELFLKDKSRKMDFELESAQRCFNLFWGEIDAEGSYSAAMKEWDVQHNASEV